MPISRHPSGSVSGASDRGGVATNTSVESAARTCAVSLVTRIVAAIPASLAARSKAFAAECRLPEP